MEDFESIHNYIASCLDLNSTQIAFFDSQLIHKKFSKKIILLKEGDICNFEAFIVKGLVKSYYIDANGSEVILTFAMENWWVSDITSFHDRLPTKIFIETLEETTLLILTPDSKEKLLKELPQFERLFRLLVQRHLGSFQERLFFNRALNAEERYNIFINRYPSLTQRLPQHLIASYIGISPEFLSRIRNRKKPHKKI